MKLIKGQLVILTYFLEGEDASWEYGVVEHIYDGNIHIIKEHGGRYMHITTNSNNDEYDSLLGRQSSKIYVTPLTSNGEPVWSGKNIFGKYTFKPKY